MPTAVYNPVTLSLPLNTWGQAGQSRTCDLDAHRSCSLPWLTRCVRPPLRRPKKERSASRGAVKRGSGGGGACRNPRRVQFTGAVPGDDSAGPLLARDLWLAGVSFPAVPSAQPPATHLFPSLRSVGRTRRSFPLAGCGGFCSFRPLMDEDVFACRVSFPLRYIRRCYRVSK